MKLPKAVILLAILAAAIIIFWIMPGINQAKSTTYLRVYEDTFQPVSQIASVDTSKTRHGKHTKKAYRKERIKPKEGWKKIRPEMFSRAVHFVETPLVLVDSSIVASDTIVTNIAVDSTLVKVDL